MKSPLPGLRILGVMGGIGAGKSTVAEILAAKIPAKHLDADAITTKLLDTKTISDAIENSLGPGLIADNGHLGRQKLANTVFSDDKARISLEKIMHPKIREKIFLCLEKWEKMNQPTWVVLDAPLLLEGGLIKICDFSFFVDTCDTVRAKRAQKRSNWDLNSWASREKTQSPIKNKKNAADAILSNEADLMSLTRSIQGWLPKLLALPPCSLRERWLNINPDAKNKRS